MTDERLTLAVPVDVARQMDSTATQTQIDNDTFQGSNDDPDLVASMVEDAEDEFRQATDQSMRVSRVGVAGSRPTYEDVTYKLSGHKAYRQSFSHFTFNYDYDEVEVTLDNSRVLPFDSSQGDAVYVYNGLGSSAGNNWEDITDEQYEVWTVVSHSEGIIAIHPQELQDALVGRENDGIPHGRQRLKRLRLAISYRYGGLGGERGRAAQTTLTESLTANQTGTVGVDDGAAFPISDGPGTVVVLIGREYLEVSPDPTNDEMDIKTRGLRGTTAASHDTDARVQYTPPSVRKAVAARAGMQLIQSGRYSSFMPDSEDAIDKSDMMDRLESTWQRTVDALS